MESPFSKRVPDAGSEKELRVVLGPQDDHLKEESIEVFLNTPYQVSIRSNSLYERPCFDPYRCHRPLRAEEWDGRTDPSGVLLWRRNCLRSFS